MAKERMVNTRFWNDSFISCLDPTEKLVFIYFLTNEHTNISGLYELPLKIASIETGIDESMLKKIFIRLKPKIFYILGWVCLVNFPKYQHSDNPKIKTGISRELSLIPSNILQKAIAYGYPMDRLSHSNSNSNSNSNTLPAVAGLEDKKKKMKTYQEPSIDIETGELIKETDNGGKAMKDLIAWAEKRRGGKFLNFAKQMKAISMMKNGDYSPSEIKERWQEMEKDDFWKTNGMDFMSVVGSFSKKPIKH